MNFNVCFLMYFKLTSVASIFFGKLEILSEFIKKTKSENQIINRLNATFSIAEVLVQFCYYKGNIQSNEYFIKNIKREKR